MAVLMAACSGDDDGDGTDAAATSTTAPIVSTAPTEGVDGDGAPAETVPVTALAPVETTYPLSGTTADDQDTLVRPALAVKIDNTSLARPQAGINDADVVFEELVEGGLTRLLAIYHSADAADIGPVRSARSTDVPILATLGEPLFAWSGANTAFAALIEASNVVDVGVEVAFGAYRSAEPERQPPAHLFTSSAALYEAAGGRGGPPRQMFRYITDVDDPPPSARPIIGVDIDFGVTDVSFDWDEELGGWTRVQDGEPHVDTDGQVVAPENVVVRFAEYIDSGAVDVNGAPVPEAVLQGQGVAWYLVDGMLIEGTWDQRALTAPVQYLALNGTFARLTPGQTWIELAPPETVTVR